MDNRLLVTRGQWGWGKGKIEKRVKYMVTDGK